MFECYKLLYMMQKYCLLMILTIAMDKTGSLKTYIEGYYWRDYEGIKPTDALPGGLDENGRSLYIGQVLFDSKLVPGKIYENGKNIYYEWGHKELTATKNIKILCSEYSEKFEWVAARHNEVVRLTKKLLIKGGYEPGYFTYIGRAFVAGETSVGKLICLENDCLGLYITKEGKVSEHRDAFEVLTFNPNANLTEVCECSSPTDIVLE